MDTDEFLMRVRQATQLADTDEDWTPAQILQEATQCLFERFVQPVVVTRSGYWLQTYDTNTIAGLAFYRIPPRAVVQGLELFCMTTPNNSTTVWSQLAVLTGSQAVDYDSQPLNGVPQWFSFESDGLMLYPTPLEARPLRMKYYLRPAQLVEVPEHDTSVYGFGIAPNQVIVNSIPADLPWSPTGGDIVDIVHTNGASEAIALSLYVSNIAAGPYPNTSTITFSTPLTDTQRVRMAPVDTVTCAAVVTADTIWTIPLPVELHSSLVAFVAAAILVDKGDGEKAAQLVSRCEAGVKAIIDVMTPRVKARPFVFRSRSSYLRRRAGWRTGQW